MTTWIESKSLAFSWAHVFLEFFALSAFILGSIKNENVRKWGICTISMISMVLIYHMWVRYFLTWKVILRTIVALKMSSAEINELIEEYMNTVLSHLIFGSSLISINLVSNAARACAVAFLWADVSVFLSQESVKNNWKISDWEQLV